MILAGAVLLSFAVTFVFMVALRPLALNVGLVDRPGGRKSHIGEVPVIGGLSMFLGVIVGLMLLPAQYGNTYYLLSAGGVLVGIGLFDDRFGLTAAPRLIAQLIATLIMIYGAGIIVGDLGDFLGVGTIGLGSMAVPVTILVTITVINAFNLVDGVDGLAGSMAIVALAAIALVSMSSASMFAMVSVSLAAIAGFLLFNFPSIANRRIRSFMGDSGSTFLGLIVVWLTIGISQGEGRVVSPVIGLWFAAIPVFDLFTCLVRRILRGKSPFTPGRDHYHHQLKRSGMGVRKVLFVLTLLQAGYATAGLIGHFTQVPETIMFGAWLVLGISQYALIRRFAVLYRHANWGKPLVRSLV